MASHESSRKKRKMSYADGRAPVPSAPPVIASSSVLALPPTATMDKTANAPCHHEQILKALNTDLDAMRQLVTCKICDRFLYEPYALSCGHTYCYSCLSQWLGSNPKMTCPDCRTVIRQQPTPSYLIRELVLVFVSRNELLPDGETAEEHNKAVREEAEIVAKDKANTDRRTGGLFKGRFNRSRLGLLGPLRDPGDGVDRCPGCHWELEDGHCNHCGFEVDDLDGDFSLDDSDSALSDEELDHEIDLDDGDAFVGADGEDHYPWDQAIMFREDAPRGRGLPQFDRAGPIDLASSDEESEEDEYDQNDTFIDDEAIEEEDGSDAESDVTAGREAAPPARRRLAHGRPAPVVISDDEDEDGDVAVVRSRAAPARPQHGHPRARHLALSEDEDEDEDIDESAPSTARDESESDSEDEGPVVRGSQRNKRPNVAVRSRRAVTVSSSDDESDGLDDDGRSEGTAQGGFSPIDDGFGEEGSVVTDYDGFDDHDGEDDGEAVAIGGLDAHAFNPYDVDNASADGYDDDESDDGYSDYH